VTRRPRLACCLSYCERRVLKLRYSLGGEYPRTLDEVRRTFNMTRERIRQIESQPLKKPQNLRETQTLRDINTSPRTRSPAQPGGSSRTARRASNRRLATTRENLSRQGLGDPGIRRVHDLPVSHTGRRLSPLQKRSTGPSPRACGAA